MHHMFTYKENVFKELFLDKLYLPVHLSTNGFRANFCHCMNPDC